MGFMMGQQKIESLTGLRALAAMWVIWFHAMGSPSVWYLDNFLRRGYTGVDLFFVLSGSKESGSPQLLEKPSDGESH